MQIGHSGVGAFALAGVVGSRLAIVFLAVRVARAVEPLATLLGGFGRSLLRKMGRGAGGAGRAWAGRLAAACAAKASASAAAIRAPAARAWAARACGVLASAGRARVAGTRGGRAWAG